MPPQPRRRGKRRCPLTAPAISPGTPAAGTSTRSNEHTTPSIAKNGDPATVGLLAGKAGVSRSWIYTQPELRDRIERLQQKRARTSSRTGRTSSRASEESLRRRLTLAHQRIAQLRTENQQLRDELARAHGELRATRTDARPPGVKQTKTRG